LPRDVGIKEVGDNEIYGKTESKESR